MRPSASVAPSAITSSPRSSSTRTPWAGRPAAVSRTWVETVVTVAPPSLGEPDRLDAVLLRDLALVGADEVPAPDDLLAGDVEPVDAVRPREDEVRDGVD